MLGEGPDSQGMKSESFFLQWLRARVLAGETQAVVGASLGVCRTLVGQWLSGRSHPSRTVLILGEMLAKRDVGEWPIEPDVNDHSST